MTSFSAGSAGSRGCFFGVFLPLVDFRFSAFLAGVLSEVKGTSWPFSSEGCSNSTVTSFSAGSADSRGCFFGVFLLLVDFRFSAFLAGTSNSGLGSDDSISSFVSITAGAMTVSSTLCSTDSSFSSTAITSPPVSLLSSLVSSSTTVFWSSSEVLLSISFATVSSTTSLSSSTTCSVMTAASLIGLSSATSSSTPPLETTGASSSTAGAASSTSGTGITTESGSETCVSVSIGSSSLSSSVLFWSTSTVADSGSGSITGIASFSSWSSGSAIPLAATSSTFSAPVSSAMSTIVSLPSTACFTFFFFFFFGCLTSSPTSATLLELTFSSLATLTSSSFSSLCLPRGEELDKSTPPAVAISLRSLYSNFRFLVKISGWIAIVVIKDVNCSWSTLKLTDLEIIGLKRFSIITRLRSFLGVLDRAVT